MKRSLMIVNSGYLGDVRPNAITNEDVDPLLPLGTPVETIAGGSTTPHEATEVDELTGFTRRLDEAGVIYPSDVMGIFPPRKVENDMGGVDVEPLMPLDTGF